MRVNLYFFVFLLYRSPYALLSIGYSRLSFKLGFAGSKDVPNYALRPAVGL